MSDEISELDATAQADLVRKGELQPRDLVEAAIRRIETVDRELHSVAIPMFDMALDDAAAADESGPFAGVPTVMKDCQPSKDGPSTQGIAKLQEIGYHDDHDAFIVAKMRQAGLILVGKAAMPQLQSGITTEPVLYGPTHNPWRHGYSVGGSSGGSAAAVAAGIVPVAHAIDGGGSIRIPSSLCGVVGLKPSRGRTSMGPVYGDGTDPIGVNTGHLITRSVRDTAAALDALAGAMPGDQFAVPPPARAYVDELHDPSRPLRIGCWRPDRSTLDVHPDCVAAVEQTARDLEALGHIVEVTHPAAFDEGLPESFFTFCMAWLGWSVADVEARAGVELSETDLDPVVWLGAQAARQVTAVDLMIALSDLLGYARRFASWWVDGPDLLLTPTIAVPPYPHGAATAPSADEPFPDVQPWVPFTVQYNLSGLPAISLPMYWNADNLPIGVMLGAAFGREDLLVSVAAQLEQARPWATRKPPTHA